MMNRIHLGIASLFVSALFSLPALAAAENYTLDPNHTNIVWSANHFGFSTVYGKFANVQGTLTLDEAKPENSKVTVTVSPANIVTGIDKFDAHLKSDAFFDVAKFPTATFESTRVEVIQPSKTAKVYGNLTLHGVTKPIILNVTLNKIGESPVTRKKTAGFSATTVIKRSDFGMTFALPGVSDDILLTIESEASAS